MPSTARLPSGALQTAEQRFRLLVGTLDVGAAKLVALTSSHARVLPDRREEAFLAPRRAVVAFRIAQQDDASLAVEQLGHVLAGEPSSRRRCRWRRS